MRGTVLLQFLFVRIFFIIAQAYIVIFSLENVTASLQQILRTSFTELRKYVYSTVNVNFDVV